jgi:hypothetical protein
LGGQYAPLTVEDFDPPNYGPGFNFFMWQAVKQELKKIYGTYGIAGSSTQAGAESAGEFPSTSRTETKNSNCEPEPLKEEQEVGKPLRKRCEFIYEDKGRPNSAFRICAYKCRGYGALATFPWPKDLKCPESFDGLFPNIPPGYPDPNALDS